MDMINIPSLLEKDLFSAVSEAVAPCEFSSFQIGISWSESKTKWELKQELRDKIVSFIESKFKAKQVDVNYELYLVLNFDRMIIQTTPSNIFIEGVYKKFSRKIAQTFHYCFKCKGRGCKNCNFKGKLSEESVQELIEKIMLPAFDSKESKFHGCGREDVDVRMLGKGRPFVIELVHALKRKVSLKKIEEKIKSSFSEKINVSNLSFSSKEKVIKLKNTSFEKIYFAKCKCEKKLTKEAFQKLTINKKISIVQKTPIRVEKRRVLKDRIKYATILEANIISEDEFEVKILASHGLYIKEFISGDEERTNPNISSLLENKSVCLELDVLEIIL